MIVQGKYKRVEIAKYEKAKATTTVEVGLVGQDVAAALVDRGITKKVAQRLADRHSQARILEKVEFLDYKLKQGEAVKSPAGYLRRAIEEDWKAPAGFVSKAEQTKAAAANQPGWWWLMIPYTQYES